MASRQKKKSTALEVTTPDQYLRFQENDLQEIKINPIAKELMEAAKKVTKVKPYSGDIMGWFSSRCYLIDLMLSKGKGFPLSKIIHLCGDEGSGKTFLCMSAALDILLRGGTVFWFNQEDGWSWELAELVGIKKGHPNFILYPPMLAEKCFDTIAAQLKILAGKNDIVLFVIDSLGGSLTLDRDATDVEKGRKVGDIQRLAKDFMAKTVPYIPFTLASIMVTNHVYVDISTFTPAGIPKPKKATGGKAVPYRAWVEIFTQPRPVVKKKGGEILHGQVRLKTIKNKGYIKELVVDIPIFFKQRRNRVFGVDDAMTCVDYLIKRGVWTTKVRNKRKVIITHIEDIWGTANEIRDYMMGFDDVYKSVRDKVEETFLKQFGIE